MASSFQECLGRLILVVCFDCLNPGMLHLGKLSRVRDDSEETTAAVCIWVSRDLLSLSSLSSPVWCFLISLWSFTGLVESVGDL